MNRSLIIFDMDGVLIDVSGSYREVTRRTVVEYLRSVIGADSLSDDVLTLHDVDRIKKTGGLNNDWDLSYAILNAILTTYVDPHNSTPAREFGTYCSKKRDKQLLSFARKAQKKIDTTALFSHIGTNPLSDLYFESSRPGALVSPFLLNRGDVKSGNIVKRIFQELYLGGKLFEKIYGEAPLFFQREGYISREMLIPSREHLEALFHAHTLSIATGRPGVEAHFAIDRFGLSPFFATVVTEDDVLQAESFEKRSLRKPDPFSLLQCMGKSGFSTGDAVSYVGDMPDDMSAAQNAGATPLGFVNALNRNSDDVNGEHCGLLFREGALRVFQHFDELVAYFS
jgi:HAD superfamily hydrolase (TIGR01548 family)